MESHFNYEASQLSSKLVAIVADNAEVEAVSEGTASLIFAETPFYAEWVDRSLTMDKSWMLQETLLRL